jgi:tRNA(fMet)-specific endonuclease VapC
MFMLDTNVLIALQKRNKAVLEKIASLSDSDVAISSIVELEFRVGLQRPELEPDEFAWGQAILDSLRVFSFESSAAKHGALLRGQVGKSNNYDLLIAAHAIAMGKVLVTNNTKDFENIPGLKLDNWAE